MSAQRTITVALVGNPNTGKSTLFNALSGMRQHVGNYAGVTVELMDGYFDHNGIRVNVIDLPGTYSLAARSPDEAIAVDLLLGRCANHARPDVILNIVDASNLDRHLYLTTQLMELGLPVVLAMNMIDVAADQGIRCDIEKLSQATGLPVVPIQANRGLGLDALKAAILNARHGAHFSLPAPILREAETLWTKLNGDCPPFLARRLLLDIGGAAESRLTATQSDLGRMLDEARKRLADAGYPIPAAEAKARYAWVREVVKTGVEKPPLPPPSLTDRIDRVLTHKIWGTLIFLAIMAVIFQSIFWIADPAKNAVTWIIGGAQDTLKEAMSPGPLRALLTDGILGGVGSIIVFLPQILLLFGFLAILEDCGYMARAAFLMDKLMSRCGLSGKSFIPLLSSVACAVPGIMATRVIENPRDRLTTILVAPLMSCSARLPVYTLLIGTFLGTNAGYPFWVAGAVLFAMYMIGFITAPLMALLLKRSLLRGAAPAYVMELPIYRRPSLIAVIRRMLGAGGSFLRRAGTFILAAMILVWAATYFPNHDNQGERYDLKLAALEEQNDTEAAQRLQSEWHRQSWLGQAGQTLEPLFKPLGWDWKLGMATLASFPAREVIVGTLGIIYNLGPEAGESDMLGSAIRQDWGSDPIRSRYAVPVALSVMVFFALCCQCVSTLAVIRRETRSWAWPVFAFIYMTLLAYIAAWATFQIGRLVVDKLT